jgi:hypothetical protein
MITVLVHQVMQQHLAAVSAPDLTVLPHPNTGSTIKSVLEIVFSVMGAVSLLILVLAGFSFITSQGDAQKVATARNAIIYASAGLAVSILAVSLVGFVIGHLG